MATRPDPARPPNVTGERAPASPASHRPDPVRLAELAARAHELAGSEGIPEAFQALADRMPGATSGTAMYGWGVRISLAVGDLAAALDAAASQAASRAASERNRDAGP